METLLVDDQETLVAKLEEIAGQQGHEHVKFFTSLEDARRATTERNFDRYIADYIFEGEEKDDGLSFLEEMSERAPEAELILMTGQPLGSRTEERLLQIGGNLVHKSALDSRLVERLFSQDPVPKEASKRNENVDVGELKLRVESLEAALKDLGSVTDLLIQDIFSELNRIEDPKKNVLLIGERFMSAEDLKREVRAKTPIGIRLIKLHHSLFERLRS